MINPGGSYEKEINLYVDRGMIIYDDGEGEPEAIFYHSADDWKGCELEGKRRREIRAFLEESAVSPFLQDRGNGVKDSIMPIADTTDVLGLLKGAVDFNPTYKRLRDFTHEEFGRNVRFWENWVALEKEELEQMERHNKERG
jgi:hypothetical protein